MTTTSPSRAPALARYTAVLFSRRALPYWIILAIALALRATDQYFMSANAPTYGLLWPDSHAYDRWAREISQMFFLGYDRIPFSYGPLYPYYLGLVYLRFGAGIASAAWSQRILGAFTVVLVFWLARRVFGKRAGWLAGLGAAACPIFLLYEGEILIETLVLFLHTAAICLFVAASERKTYGWWMAGGAVLGLCCLTRPNALLLLPPVALWAFLAGPARGWKRFGAAALMVLSTLVVISPASILNYTVGGEFHLITTYGPYNLYIGNAPDTEGVFQSTPSSLAIKELEDKPEEEIDWRRYLVEALRREPLALPRALWLKTKLFWQSGEIPSGPNYYLQRDYSPLLWLPFRWAVIAPLGLLGMALTFAQRLPRLRGGDPRVLLVGWLLVFMASIVLVFVMGRLRLPALAILFVFAGHALAYVTQALQGAFDAGEGQGRLKIAVLLLVLWPVLGLGLRTRDADLLLGWNDHFNLGRAYETQDRWAEALEQYERALTLNPEVEMLHEMIDNARKRLPEN